MKLRRPSPALVISIVALTIAAGTGGAIAQSQIRGADIRNSTITSADIRNRSISGADVRRGTLTLSTLSRGTQNRINRSGGGGGGSAGTASEAFRKNGPLNVGANAQVRVAQLALPAGAYAIVAKTVLSGQTPGGGLQQLFDQTQTAGGTCRLDAAGDVDIAVGNIVVNDRPSPATLTMQITRTFGGPSNVMLLCSGNVPFSATNTTIIATKLASVSRTESTG